VRRDESETVAWRILAVAVSLGAWALLVPGTTLGQLMLCAAMLALGAVLVHDAASLVGRALILMRGPVPSAWGPRPAWPQHIARRIVSVFLRGGNGPRAPGRLAVPTAIA